MNSFFKQTESQTRIFALVYIVFGFILCFFNKSILFTATRIIGGVLLLYGAYQLYLYFAKKQFASTSTLIFGVLSALFGLFFLISPQSLIAILTVLCGVILILNSAMQMQKSFTLRSHGYDNWIYAFIISLVILIGGIILLLRPIQTMKFILQLVGICLMVEGVIILVNQHEINKYLD